LELGEIMLSLRPGGVVLVNDYGSWKLRLPCLKQKSIGDVALRRAIESIGFDTV
jgi:hypothetical protein